MCKLIDCTNDLISAHKFPSPYPHAKTLTEVFYNKNVIDPGLKVIRKDEDMNVQDLAMAQQQLSKFTHKLARKDKISLV